MLAALVLVAAVSTDAKCDDVPACVAEAEQHPAHFTRELLSRLEHLPARRWIAGLEWQHANPAVTERVHDIIGGRLPSRLETTLQSVEDARAVLAWARKQDDAAAMVSRVASTIRQSRFKSVLDGCVGPDEAGLQCALWAAHGGSTHPAVVARIAEALDSGVDHPVLPETIAKSAPLSGLFRKRVGTLRAKSAPLGPTDARMLHEIQQKWAFEALAFWIRHPDPAMARTALEAALDFRIGRYDTPLRHEALVRLVGEPVFGRQQQAAQAIASTDFEPDETTREVFVRLAIDDPQLRPALVEVLLPHVHRDPRIQRLAVSLIEKGDWSPWPRLTDVPASTCWLVKPTLAQLERTSGRHAGVRPVSEWVNARWGKDFLREAHDELDPASAKEEDEERRTSTEFKLASDGVWPPDVLADRKAFNHPAPAPTPAVVGPSPEPEFDAVWESVGDPLIASTAQIHELARERLIAFLRSPPPLERSVRCPPAAASLSRPSKAPRTRAWPGPGARGRGRPGPAPQGAAVVDPRRPRRK